MATDGGTDDGGDPTFSDDPGLSPTQGTEATGGDAHHPVLAAPGYQLGEVIGRGGMGEVVVAHDQRIGRRVAIKRLRSTQPSQDAVRRFLREAKIQARLDHPAIVPVHELGYDAEGRPYFTMKRLTGVTLHDVLASETQPQKRMLRALIDACLAIEFAHSRGVVHRDLKPSNIMLGDYGEVYVLDWGVARITDQAEPTPSTRAITDVGTTQAGEILGTLGYAAPEQLKSARDAGPPADVYALGCILFEILTGKSRHPRGEGAIASTLAETVERPSDRCPERGIAPELDAACAAALAIDPAARPNARGLADRIQRYLDGDRDVEDRRAMAVEQLASANSALAAGDRARAMNAAGRALALDPAAKEPAALVTQLMLEPPPELPAELVGRLADVDVVQSRRQSRLAALMFCVFFAFIPVVLWQGVTDWRLFAGIYGLVLTLAFNAEVSHRRGRTDMTLALIGASALIILFSRVYGPFIFVPGMVALFAFAFASHPTLIDRPLLPIGLLAFSMCLPLVLEYTGTFAPTWTVMPDGVLSRSAGLRIHAPATSVFLIATNFGLVITIGLLARSLAASRREAQRTIEIQAWHLRQLLPRTD